MDYLIEKVYSTLQKIQLTVYKKMKMKNYNFKVLFSTLFILLISLLLFSSFNSPEEDIVGSWIQEEESNIRWVFTANGNCYWYNNSTIVESFTYEISQTLPQCRYNVKTGGAEDYYLRLTDSENSKFCYEILTINNEVLSLNYLGTSDIKVFNKE
jgi:hypothetical protein